MMVQRELSTSGKIIHGCVIKNLNFPFLFCFYSNSFGLSQSSLSRSQSLLTSPSPWCFPPFFSLKREKKATLNPPLLTPGKKKACISRQDAWADNIDPWLPLKHLLCLTDFPLLDFTCRRMNQRCLLKMSVRAACLSVQKWSKEVIFIAFSCKFLLFRVSL